MADTCINLSKVVWFVHLLIVVKEAWPLCLLVLVKVVRLLLLVTVAWIMCLLILVKEACPMHLNVKEVGVAYASVNLGKESMACVCLLTLVK